MIHALFLFFGLAVSPPAHAGGEPKVQGPIETAEDAIKEKKSEKELAAEARLKAIDDANSEKIARIVVLQARNTDTDYTNETVQRNVRVRIARPNAMFYPEIDLYQAGRKEPDRTIRAVDQRAVVPESAIPRVLAAVEDVSTIPWNALSAQDWGLKANELRDLSNEIWFVDRPELREPLFLLYSQIGYAAENRNDPAPPFYEQIGGRPVNYYWYLAGAMAHDEPGLMSKLTDQDLHASIGYYKDLLDRGEIQNQQLSFELSGEFDSKSFASDYQLYINGLEVLITDEKGHYRIPPGRIDVYMSRDDGHSLSDRVQLDQLDDKFYNVRDVARQVMGLKFQDQLLEHPNECTPELDGEILDYLSIYAKLHPAAEIYIALPKGGSTSANNILLWRWVRERGVLEKVLGEGEFPVRFAILVGAGLSFNNATYTPPTSEKIAEDAAKANPADPTAGIDAVKRTLDALPKLAPAGVPIQYQLRGHYGRLLINTGMEYSANVTKEGKWRDLYQTDIKDGIDENPNPHELKDVDTVTVLVPVDPGTGTGFDPSQVNCADPAASCEETEIEVPVDVLRERTWQRLVHLGVGVVMGKNAAIGFGPRLLLRTGWYNAPHAADLTGHIGWSAQAPFSKKATGRVRPLVDVDLFGGAMIPYRDSVYTPGLNKNGKPKKLGDPLVTFGFEVGIGTTF